MRIHTHENWYAHRSTNADTCQPATGLSAGGMSFSTKVRIPISLDDGEACSKDGTVGCTAPVHNHEELYRHARVYDVAFGYRDFAAEVAFLRACHARWGTGATDSFLEVAAGPGVHAIVAA